MPSSWSRALPILGIVVILILLLVWPQHAGRKNTAFAKLQDAPVSAASHAAPQLPNALRTHNDSNISSSAPAPAPESGPGRRAEPSTALNRDTSSEFLPPTAASAPPPVPPDTVTWRVWYPEAKNLTWYPKPPKSLPQPWWNDITARTGSEKEALYPFKNIIDLQWPNGGSATACKAARTLEVHLHGYEGLFASINSVAACLALALHLNRTFIIRGGGSIYATEGQCGVHHIYWWNCLFEPLTPCAAQSIKIAKGITMNYIPRASKHIYIHFHQFTTLLKHNWKNPPLTGPEVAHNAHILAYMFRPVAPIHEYAQRVKRWLGLDKVKYAAVHIRMTDKKFFEYTFNTKQFVELLVTNVANSAIRTVFVMTDTITVLKELMVLQTPFDFVWQNEMRPEAGITPTLQKSERSSVRHSVEWLADIIIASEAAFFLGSCNSHVGRVMISLVAGRQMKPPFNEYPPNVKMIDADKCARHADDWISFVKMPQFTAQSKQAGNASWMAEAAKRDKRFAGAAKAAEKAEKQIAARKRMLNGTQWQRTRYIPGEMRAT